MATANEFVEIYHTRSEVVARKILDVILAPEGIEAVLHDRQDHAIPAPAAQAGIYGIAVAAPDAPRALDTLRQAIADGFLTDDGSVVEAAGGVAV